MLRYQLLHYYCYSRFLNINIKFPFLKNFYILYNEDIYSIYLEGGDYEKALSEKQEREKAEQEERRKLNEEGKKIIQDTEEEIGLDNQINDNEEKKEEKEINQNEKEEKEEKEEEHVENENPFAAPEIESSSEETEEDKSFNDILYWNISPNIDEKTGKKILNDLD